MTIYGGDWNHKLLIVVVKGSQSPKYIDIEHQPRRGILIKNDTILLIGCEDGILLYYSLFSP